MRQRQVVARVAESFLGAYTFAPKQQPTAPRAVRYYRQAGGGEHRMPIAIFPAGIPKAGESCVVRIEADNRIRLHNQDAPTWKRVPGGRTILRIFRFDDYEHVSRSARLTLQVGGDGEVLAAHPEGRVAPVVLAEA